MLSSMIGILATFISIACYREAPYINEIHDKATVDTSPITTNTEEMEVLIADSKIDEIDRQSDESRDQAEIKNQLPENKSKAVTLEEIRTWSSFRQTYYLAKVMPKELFHLWVTSTLGWLSFTAFITFYTNFVGVSIYHGNPVAPENSTAFANYRRGVRNGSWGLLGYTIVSAIYSLMMVQLAKYFG